MKFNCQIVSNKSELLKHLPIFHDGDETFIVSHDEHISKRYYESIFLVDYDIQDICFHYLKILNGIWTIIWDNLDAIILIFIRMNMHRFLKIV